MRITFENDKKLTLIYIYVREFDGYRAINNEIFMQSKDIRKDDKN